MDKAASRILTKNVGPQEVLQNLLLLNSMTLSHTRACDFKSCSDKK